MPAPGLRRGLLGATGSSSGVWYHSVRWLIVGVLDAFVFLDRRRPRERPRRGDQPRGSGRHLAAGVATVAMVAADLRPRDAADDQRDRNA